MVTFSIIRDRRSYGSERALRYDSTASSIEPVLRLGDDALDDLAAQQPQVVDERVPGHPLPAIGRGQGGRPGLDQVEVERARRCVKNARVTAGIERPVAWATAMMSGA